MVLCAQLCLFFLPRTSNVWLVMGCCLSAAAWWARSVCGMLRPATASPLFPNRGKWCLYHVIQLWAGPSTTAAQQLVQTHLLEIRTSDSRGGKTDLLLLCFRLRRDSSGIFDYQESWDHSPDGKNGLDDSFENSHQLKRMLSPPQPPLFCDQPDLTSLIDTNFSEQVKVAESETRLRAVGSRQKETGYDFSSLVGKVYEEHGTSNCMNFTGLSAPHGQAGFCVGSGSSRSLGCGTEEGGCSSRRRSLGDESFTGFDKSSPLPSWGGDFESSVWSLDLQGNLIVAGRSNGKLEVRSKARCQPRHWVSCRCRCRDGVVQSWCRCLYQNHQHRARSPSGCRLGQAPGQKFLFCTENLSVSA